MKNDNPLAMMHNDNNVEYGEVAKSGGIEATKRRQVFTLSASLAFTALTTQLLPPMAMAAPPIAVIAEELGYFPVRNPNTGELMYVPQRVKRNSSEQAMELAQKLKEQNVVLAGTYWCPHTTRQKELLGRQAFNEIKYLECSSQGYQGNPAVCRAQNVDGYPTWLFRNGKQISGEQPLSILAEAVGMKGFNEDLEENVPPPLGSKACSK